MRRSLQLTLALLITASAATSVEAGWDEFWARVHLDYHRNVCWPEPFIHADRDSLREHYAVYERMGWQRQNTLGVNHFHPETHQLNSAGVQKVLEVVTHSPPQRRTVFVLQGVDQNMTATRIDSVQQTIAAILPEGDLPSVVQTHVPPVLRPGRQINTIENQYRNGQPAPQLPAMQAAGGL